MCKHHHDGGQDILSTDGITTKKKKNPKNIHALLSRRRMLNYDNIDCPFV